MIYYPRDKMLEVKSIYLYRNKKQILSNFNLILKKKDIILLLGENGVGKSSLLDTIVGLIEPYSGNIFIQGQSLKEIESKKKRYFTYLPHESCLKDNFSVEENIKIWLSLNSIQLNNKEIYKRFKVFNLFDLKDQNVSNLSHGQKKICFFQYRKNCKKTWVGDKQITLHI